MSTIPDQRTLPRNFDVFLGMDVDKKSYAITTLDHDGVSRSFKMPADAQGVLSYCRKHLAGKRILFSYEAGPTGFGLYDALSAAGETCLVAHSAGIPKAAGDQVKTNRRDSKQLAEALRGGQIQGIRVPSETYRKLRHLTHLRNGYASQVRATKVRIKALLTLEGLAFPSAPASSQWSSRVLEELQSLPCNPAVRYTLNQRLVELQFFTHLKREALQEIVRTCQEDPETADSVRYLMSIPGIGIVVASYTVARVGDWRHLKSVRELSAFIGVVPKENSTGDRVNRGSITRSGDPALRSMLIEGAWNAVYKDPEMTKFYQNVRSRHPNDRASRIAIVAVARKLTTRMHAVLTERREYTVGSRPDKSKDTSSKE